MRRPLLHLLLLIALVFQGVVAVGAPLADDAQEQHCAGHDESKQECACCPAGTAAMSCTAQCTVCQAPTVMLTPSRCASYGVLTVYIEPAFAGLTYVPLVPPPIV